LICGAPAFAQMQQKGGEEKSPAASTKGSQQHTEQRSTAPGEKRAEPGGSASKGTKQGESPSSKRSAQTESSEKGKTSAQSQREKGSARTESKQQGSKGGAETQAKKDTKAGAQTGEKQQPGKGRAQTQPQEKATKGSAQNTPQGKTESNSSAQGASTDRRIQLSDQQRTDLHQTVLRERNVNRASNVNFSINVGTRVPRSVRLAVLPAAVISLVPLYRDYRYVVVDEQIVIIDPGTYEIVDVILAPEQTARMEHRGSQAALVLTEEEKRIVLDNIDLRGGSTLALGALTEGAPVPRDVRVEPFPDKVVRRVPKLMNHKF